MKYGNELDINSDTGKVKIVFLRFTYRVQTSFWTHDLFSLLKN